MTGMDLVWGLIWALALANLMSIPVFMAMAPAFSLLVFVRGALLIPFVLVLAFLGAYLSEASWENMLLMSCIGVLGYFLKKYGWPRPPFVIGLVLGAIAEEQQKFADAKTYYERVFAVDIQFRDVGDRLNTVERQI